MIEGLSRSVTNTLLSPVEQFVGVLLWTQLDFKVDVGSAQAVYVCGVAQVGGPWGRKWSLEKKA